MPNWCFTTIQIQHKDQTVLEKLDSLLDEWTSRNYCENDFGLNWLGNIVGNSGIDNMDKGDFTLSCRGRIYDRMLCPNELQFHTETAWRPMLEMWVVLCEKYAPGADIIYTAEESGNGIYLTNDPDLVNKFVVEDYEEDEDVTKAFEEHLGDYHWEATEQDVRNFLLACLDRDDPNGASLDELLKEAYKKHRYAFSVHRWKPADL